MLVPGYCAHWNNPPLLAVYFVPFFFGFGHQRHRIPPEDQMSEYDWSRFSLRIAINAPAQDVFAAWMSRAALEQWFLRTAEFADSTMVSRGSKSIIKAGDTYRWLWHGYDDSVAERGTILEVGDVGYLRFTFAGSCVVTVTVKTEEGLSIVELVQENIPLDDKSQQNYHLGCMTGWTFYLANLKSVLEGGLDLRNKNTRVQGVINA